MMVEGTVDPRVAELQQLQKEYRHMEVNRRAYAEESQAVLRKQQQTIERLRRENDLLKSDVAMFMRDQTKPLSATQHETLHRLHDMGDKYANSIDFEKKNIAVMEEQIYVLRQKLLHQRKNMGGVNAAKENFQMIQKQIRILENRLDKALTKYNEAVSHNKSLRDNIDDLRRERVVFESIYRKMERELQEQKRQMAEIIETSNHMYEQRDQYQMEVAAIEQANRKEQEEFENQMIELGRMLDTELRLPNTIGANENAVQQSMKRGASLGEFAKSTASPGSPGAKRTLTRSATTTLLGGEASIQERVQNFEEAFNKIKAATGIRDIDELVRTFIKHEDHNFSLFNYVNEQNNEIERLEDQIQQLREDEKRFTVETGDDVNQHKQILKELEAKLQSTESMAEKYELRCSDLQRVIETLKRGVQSIIDKLGFVELLRGENSVTDINMVAILGEIENNANNMINEYSLLKQAIARAAANTSAAGSGAAAVKAVSASAAIITAGTATTTIGMLGTGPKVPMGSEQLHVNPPKLDDYQSDDEDMDDENDARPLTRDELKARTLNRLNKRAPDRTGGPGGVGGGGGNAAKAKGQGKASKKLHATR
jgi:DNA repair exonuclease SbcCD ATPase subunit